VDVAVDRALDSRVGDPRRASTPCSPAAVQKHVAVLERAGLITKQRIGRRKVVRTNLEALLVARRLLDQFEELWRARIDRINELLAETAGAIYTVETKESKR
jgi:DNA-binding transcriptional ArsR family regulator